MIYYYKLGDLLFKIYSLDGQYFCLVTSGARRIADATSDKPSDPIKLLKGCVESQGIEFDESLVIAA